MLRFELLEEGVRVIDDTRIGSELVGESSYLITYTAFKRFLEDTEKTSKKVRMKDNPALTRLINDFGKNRGVEFPLGTVEVKKKKDGGYQIVQLVGGGGFPFFTFRDKQGVLKQGDTSRFIVEVEVTDGLVLQRVKVSTFTGLLYGKHREEDISYNEVLTHKLAEHWMPAGREGLRFNELNGINAEGVLSVITEGDMKRVKGDTLRKELYRVSEHGGRINWEGMEWQASRS